MRECDDSDEGGHYSCFVFIPFFFRAFRVIACATELATPTYNWCVLVRCALFLVSAYTVVF